MTGLVLVNGPPDSVQAPRARALFSPNARIAYKTHGRLGSIRSLWRELRALRAGWIYCIDLGFPAAPLAWLRQRLPPRVRLIYELGDPARPLLAHQGRSRSEVAFAHGLDRALPGLADRLVFRGFYLADYFRQVSTRPRLPPWIWLPDGVDTERFRPRREDAEIRALRARHQLEGRFLVGLVGTISHNPIHNLFYGWELAEALALLPPHVPITGVVIGDGPGRAVLEATRQRLGLGDRLRLLGRVPHDEVPLWMNVLDVGLSTQTNDPVGWGRTTAKLPEYLACGTVVVCTDVGEAHRLLRSLGQTLPYDGMRDATYPPRLAERLRTLQAGDLSSLRRANRAIAEKLFDYGILRRRVHRFLAGESVAPVPAAGDPL